MPWKNDKHKFIADEVGVQNYSGGDISIACPFHDDSNNSATINFQKELFNCFTSTCIGGLNFDQLHRTLTNREEIEDHTSPIKDISGKIVDNIEEIKDDLDINSIASSYLNSRGFDELPITYQVSTDKTLPSGEYNSFYGYLFLQSLDGYVTGRNLIESETRPRYLNESKKKKPFWVARNLNSKIVFVTEGVFDALSLEALGIQNVFASLGAGFPQHYKQEIAYELRGNTVLILYDNDPAGFKGSRKVSESLVEYEVDHTILEMPKKLGADINEAFVNNRHDLEKWVRTILGRFDPDDKSYVDNLFTGKEPTTLNIIKSGISELDNKLTGGFKDGAHVIAGETGVGKTSIVFHLAISAARQGKKVMINSCEISKRQSWARLASKYSSHCWEKLEAKPTLIESEALLKVKDLSKNILIVNGWPLQRIIQESPDYDMIIIDYIQRVRETYGGSDKESMHLINTYIARMSDLGALNGKVAIIVSSLSRSNYNDPSSYGFKSSGSIEYMATTASRLMPIGAGERTKFIWKIQKNTRGETGNIRISNVDLGHINFDNAESESLLDV